MLKRVFVAVAAAGSLVIFSGAAAAQQVTVLLKSGERVTGQLASFDESTVDIRDAAGQRKAIEMGQIVLFDFATGAKDLPEAEIKQMAEAKNLVVRRDGTRIAGTVADFVNEGGENAAVVFEAAGAGRQEIRLAEVSRIYVSRPAAAAETAAAPAAEAKKYRFADGPMVSSVTVPANAAWTSTMVMVRQGEVIEIEALGQIYTRAGKQDPATPNGVSAERRADAAPIPGTLVGALIGRVGENGVPFGIGTQERVTMPAAGRLFLGINDDEVSDNQGEFTVRIRRSSS